jgi:polysaccharide export outer membrane protein
MLMRCGLVVATLIVALGVGAAPVRAQTSDTYLLNPGDVVRVSVWREEELDREAVVQPDGTISFPLVGQVAAAGHSAEMVRGAIAERIDRYVPDAVVTVELLEARGNKVYVIGEVTRPGEYQLARPITVVQAISLAGGFTPFAGTGKVRVLRADGGQETALTFDYDAVAEGEAAPGNIELKAGDTVIVPSGSLF